MNNLVLSIGSNSKDREWQIKNCIKWLKHLLSNVSTSEIYNSKAANGKDPDYLNAVMEAKCRNNYDEINDILKKYEAVCGRAPISKQVGDIPMDLDIIIWNGQIVRERDFAQEYFQIGWKQLKKQDEQ